MAGDPNRKRRRRKAAAELGTDPVLDAEVRAMSDAELLREHAREASGEAAAERERAAVITANPLTGYLHNLSDDELLAEYAQATAEVSAQEAEIERRRPKPVEPTPEPVVIAAPPVEPHPVELAEPVAATESAPKLTPRQEWEREQHEQIMAAIEEAEGDGDLVARLAHEQGKRARSETMGPSELLDALGHEPTRRQQ